MACARKCDRCGKLYEEYNTKMSNTDFNGIMFLNIDYARKYYPNAPMDLCPECLKSLHEWFGVKGDKNVSNN